jgi:hypothetical protein
MSKIEELRKKHKKEIDDLQKKCKHEKISDWLQECWAPGHLTMRSVKICLECNKIVEAQNMVESATVVSTTTASTQNIQ